MKNRKKACKPLAANQNEAQVDIGRGSIKHNFLAALVTSTAYRQQIVKSKKGKGAYRRKERNKSNREEFYLMAA